MPPALQASLWDRHHLSALLGAAAILFRQTNAVWVAFILGAAGLRMVAPEAPKLAQLPAERQLLLVLRGAWLVRVLLLAGIFSACWCAHVQHCGPVGTSYHACKEPFATLAYTIAVQYYAHGCKMANFLPVQHKGRIAARLWSMAAVLAAFGAFVYANGGIVVGDKANHEPVLHAMQLPYLALFCASALAPVHFGLPRRAPSCAHPLLLGRAPLPLQASAKLA